MTPEQLKASILKSAFSGKLVKSRNDDRLPNVKEVVFEESPFEIPDNWIWSLLGNCCNMYTGNSISERVKKIKYTGISEGLDYIATKDALRNKGRGELLIDEMKITYLNIPKNPNCKTCGKE